MLCPNCQSDDLTITNSRHRAESVWRRRRCVKCKHVFSTLETIHELHAGRPVGSVKEREDK